MNRYPQSPKTAGDLVPQATLHYLDDGELHTRDSKALFADSTVVVFALPGAFTPTCSSSHLPGYAELAAEFKAHGVDEIVCISVNDAFVMHAWGGTQDAGQVTLLADGNGEFTAGMGMLVDKSDLGFGARSWRYAMLVHDGRIEKILVEPEQPGDPFEVSDAGTMLRYLAPAGAGRAVTLLTRTGCPHCARAKQALKDNGLTYEEITVGGHISERALYALAGTNKVPQVYVAGDHIGGAEQLLTWLGQVEAA